MLTKAVCNYLNSDTNYPFIIASSGNDYSKAKADLIHLDFHISSLSSFCWGYDKPPNLDDLLNNIKDIGSTKKTTIIGLGEYLGLCGNEIIEKTLSRLKDYNIGKAKAVFLFRGINSHIAKLKADPRIDKRRIFINDNAPFELNITCVSHSVEIEALNGIKSLLEKIEGDEYENLIVKTQMDLNNAIFNVSRITNSYNGIKYLLVDFNLPYNLGTDLQWSELLKKINLSGGSLELIFEKSGLSGNLETDLYNKITGFEFKNWLYFIALKYNSKMLTNEYLKHVIDITESFDNFKCNLINAIIEIPYTDSQFPIYYSNRKSLMEKFKESDIAGFVVNNRKYLDESIYKLTDNTLTEKEEIVAWIASKGSIPPIENIYPAITSYLDDYVFNCGDLSAMLTEYFRLYKYQKVINIIEPIFLKKVEELALTRDYNRLRTRDETLDNINKEGTYLCWLDALGVEFLPYIINLSKKRGLYVSISVARAELPTTTSINRGFYDNWHGKKEKVSELDEIKHKESGGYNFEDNTFPIHLAKELDVIEKVLDKAATELAKKNFKRYLIVSDHGASRLAVLHRKEEKYETETEGKHSGRCCKKFEPYDLPFAAEENGYLVLADYGRFKGSRRANVEVHGGASLEEVLVPIIELTLKDKNITVEMVEESVTVDYRTFMKITLYFNYPSLKNITAVLNGKRYFTTAISDNHFTVAFPDIKRAGSYNAEIYCGDNLIDKITIKAHSKSGKIDDRFDDLF